MEKVIVTTKKELKKAQEEKIKEIIVSGDLADKLKKSKQITKLSAAGLAILTTALGIGTLAAPATGGLSIPVSGIVAAPVATVTGLEIAAIITAASLGLGLIIALFKDYEEISFEKGKMTLRKRQL